MSCKFCDGDGQILVTEYIIKYLKRNGKSNIIRPKKGFFLDCPKCKGIGKVFK